MKLRFALAGLCAALVGLVGGPAPAEAAPGLLQLPWPAGTEHRINGGNTYGCGTHTGGDYYAIDFQFAINEIISATAAGQVISRGDANDGYGKKVVIAHGGGYTSLYGHLNDFAVSLGATVSQGQTIGYADATGYVDPPGAHHLHFRMQSGNAAYKAEPMSWASGLGRYGRSLISEGGLGCSSYRTSPDWASRPPVTVVTGDFDGDGDTDRAVWRIDTAPAEAAPGVLQLPWPAGTEHRINPKRASAANLLFSITWKALERAFL